MIPAAPLGLALLLLGGPGGKLEPAEVWPREIVLSGPGAFHAILTPGDIASRDPSVARVEGRRVLAVGDGETALETAGAEVRVVVRDTTKPRLLDFSSVIIPVLTRSGCNAAACHGAALGQAGFKLSLFGNDPQADYLAITHELSGRRIDRARPELSLILRKPSRRLPHRGGRVLSEDGEGYQTLLAWARRGFPASEDELSVERLEVRGSEQVLARAWYSDGVGRDVTHLAQFTSNDDAIAQVDELGRVALKGPGETSIMVRFSGHVAALRVGRPFPGEPGRPPARLPVRNFVDEHVGRTLLRLGLEPSGECSDEAFVRRAFLDLIGTLPGSEEVRAFLAKPDRDGLVEKLLARNEFDDYWAYRLGQLFGVSSHRMGEEGAAAFHGWLKGQVRRPWAETARGVLTAIGRSPPTGFYRLAGDPREMAEQVGRVFLGSRWQCAQCHNHPFERFRQGDYYGLAAMFARVRETDQGIVHLPRGEITFPRTGREVPPRFPDGEPGDLSGDRREKLAAWVVSQDQFRRAFANRIWALLLGRGLVQPVDDFRSSNPPSHPELLDDLSRLETLPGIVAAIARSAAYRLAGPTPQNRGDERVYSHTYPRPLSAEVLVDAIARASGVPDGYRGRPAGTRAIELGDSSFPSYTLDVCGRGRPAFEGSLAQELHLLVGAAVGPKLEGARALLLLDDGPLVEELYLRTLSRRPRAEEIGRWTAELPAAAGLRAGPRGEVAEDLLWALLNSWEFMTCH